MWHDRDEFISINRENIDPRMNISFKKTPYEVKWADTQHTPYDFNSVTKFEERVDLGTQSIWAICSTSLDSKRFLVLKIAPKNLLIMVTKTGEEVVRLKR